MSDTQAGASHPRATRGYGLDSTKSISAAATVRSARCLVAADPANADWQRRLAVSYGRVAVVEARQGARDQALSKFRNARDIIARLMAQSPDNAQLPKDLAGFESQIRALSALR